MSRHLIARIRHAHAAGGDGLHLDWEDLAPHVGHAARLENGDHAYAFPVGDQWGYVLYGPKTRHDHNPNLPDDPRSYQRFTGDDEHVYSEVLGGSRINNGLHPDAHSAMREAEEHYFGLGRRGQAPASDLDYEALVNPRDDLDDDFGHIFGRRTAAANWQRGVLIPETASHMESYNEKQSRGLYGPSSVSPPWSPEDVSTAVVHHGERLHALQVNHETTIEGAPYLWSIHEHDGVTDPKVGGWEHLDPGDHAEECDLCEAGPGEKCHPDCWDQNSHTGGPLRTTLDEAHYAGEWQDGSRGELWGWQSDRESAQRAAETAWARYTSERGHGLGGVDLDEVARGDGPTGGHSLGDEDYGDIFGEGR